jgi:hypothetical protein
MANHNKNKRFGGSNFERVRKSRPVGQDALERDRERNLERAAQRRSIEIEEDFYSSYEDLD